MNRSTKLAILERFTPIKLDGRLLAWWDAERPDLMTTSTGISSWKDVVAGYDMTQATGAAQPVWSPTSFGGFPGMTFDGTDDCLASIATDLLAVLPFNADPCEIWSVVQQDALAADTTTREVFSYGGASTQLSRRAERVVASAVNRVRVLQGNGTTSDTAAGTTTIDFSTRHVMRCVCGPSSISVYLDGVVGATTASTGGIGQVRARIGATQVSTAAQFWQGKIAAILVTLPLPEDKTAALHSYMMNRRRL